MAIWRCCKLLQQTLVKKTNISLSYCHFHFFQGHLFLFFKIPHQCKNWKLQECSSQDQTIRIKVHNESKRIVHCLHLCTCGSFFQQTLWLMTNWPNCSKTLPPSPFTHVRNSSWTNRWTWGRLCAPSNNWWYRWYGLSQHKYTSIFQQQLCGVC